MKTPSSEKLPSQLFEKYNWCFSDCPDNQTLFCQNYEYNRELKDDHLPLTGWRREAKGHCFEQLLKLVGKPGSLSFLKFNCHLYPFYLYPEWPDDPYLTIDPKERKKRRDLLYGHFRLRSHFALFIQYAAVKECAEELLKPDELPIVISGDDFVVPFRFSIWESKEAWLQRAREVLDYLDRIRGHGWPAIKADIDKKRDLFSHHKSALKALGGFRLINQCGGVEKNGDLRGLVTEAAAQKCREAHVKPLFGTHRRWRAAYILAKDCLKIYKSSLIRASANSPERSA
jgi:hypothetical protein